MGIQQKIDEVKFCGKIWQHYGEHLPDNERNEIGYILDTYHNAEIGKFALLYLALTDLNICADSYAIFLNEIHKQWISGTPYIIYSDERYKSECDGWNNLNNQNWDIPYNTVCSIIKNLGILSIISLTYRRRTVKNKFFDIYCKNISLIYRERFCYNLLIILLLLFVIAEKGFSQDQSITQVLARETLAFLAEQSSNSPLYIGNNGLSIIARINASLKNATQLRSSSDIMLYRATTSLTQGISENDFYKLVRGKASGLVFTGSNNDTMQVMEMGISKILLISILNYVDKHEFKDAVIDRLKNMLNLSTTESASIWNIYKSLNLTSLLAVYNSINTILDYFPISTSLTRVWKYGQFTSIERVTECYMESSRNIIIEVTHSDEFNYKSTTYAASIARYKIDVINGYVYLIASGEFHSLLSYDQMIGILNDRENLILNSYEEPYPIAMAYFNKEGKTNNNKLMYKSYKDSIDIGGKQFNDCIVFEKDEYITENFRSLNRTYYARGVGYVYYEWYDKDKNSWVTWEREEGDGFMRVENR